jgi:allene oxide cyclase
MRRALFGMALVAFVVLAGFGTRGFVFAQGATPVTEGTPIAEQPVTPEATPTVTGGNVVTLIVVERATSDTTIDLGETGDSIGDLLVFANDIYDESNTDQIGTDQGSCVRTVPGTAYECAWTLTLADGQIMVQGPFLDSDESVLAITGGTGAYVGVSGQARVRALSDAENQFTYELQ